MFRAHYTSPYVHIQCTVYILTFSCQHWIETPTSFDLFLELIFKLVASFQRNILKAQAWRLGCFIYYLRQRNHEVVKDQIAELVALLLTRIIYCSLAYSLKHSRHFQLGPCSELSELFALFRMLVLGIFKYCHFAASFVKYKNRFFFFPSTLKQKLFISLRKKASRTFRCFASRLDKMPL